MKVIFKGYEGEVVSIDGVELFYTLDPAAEGYLWKNFDRYINAHTVPKGAYCWWLCHEEDGEVTYYDGRRRRL